ncbi:MAG TPA: ribosomal protein S18-alanine N-acetyltransferase [Terriglobales bacterium]|nr:ribosomal protein S18-alanine N-acetyltransferase [Terriglobales bacterium]
MAHFRIRPGTAADIPTLMSLERQTPTASHWSLKLYQAALAEESTRTVLVIESEGALLGFLVAHAIKDELEIENIAIAEATRRQGMATRLVEKLLESTPGQALRKVFLEVRESNFAARGLYEKCGFVRAGYRPRYYRDPEEAAISYQFTIS